MGDWLVKKTIFCFCNHFPAQSVQHQHRRWWISVPVLPNWAAGTPKSSWVNRKRMPLLIGRREWWCLAPQGPFRRQARNTVTTTLCLFTTLSWIMFVLLSVFLSVAYFYSHKVINIFAVFFPASTLDYSCFLLLPLFICHAVSLQSRAHLSKTKLFHHLL